MDTKVWLLGILSGLFWSLGQSQQFQAMKYMGVSMTVPMSTGMQLVANTLAGALLFSEWKTGSTVGLGLLALFFLILGSTLTSRKEKSDQVSGENSVGKGIRTLLISTAGYAGYTIVFKAGNLDALATVLHKVLGWLSGPACSLSVRMR